MRGVAPLVVAAIVAIVALLGIGAYVATSGGASLSFGGPSVNEIIQRNLGYMCEWNGTLKTYLGSFDVTGRFYFHGKRFRMELPGLAGKTVFVDPDLTDEKGTVYQWAQLGSTVALSVSFTKEERPPSSYEKILQIVYTERDRPFQQVLEETLRSVSPVRGASFGLKSVRCTEWTPDDSLFQPPKKQ